MLNYRRHRSYNSGTPNSCAVSVFGLGVVLTLGGIVLMVITKNTKHKDESDIKTTEHYDKESQHYRPNDDISKRNKNRSAYIDNTLKTLGPILLGFGITIIVLFLFIITAVAWRRGLKAPITNSQFPSAIDHSANSASGRCVEGSYDCTQPSFVVNPPSSSIPLPKAPNPQQSEYSMHSTSGIHGPLLGRPPSYDEICIQERSGGNSRHTNDNLIPLKSV